MSNPLSKISKISYNQVNEMFQKIMAEKFKQAEERVYENLADAMLGKDFTDKSVRDQKIKDLKQGKYDKLEIKIYPLELLQKEELSNFKTINQFVLATVEEAKYGLLQVYKQNIRLKLQLDAQQQKKKAVKLVEEHGIVFIDQIDKLVASEGLFKQHSRQGVQRDLLPLIEGTMVQTDIGQVNTSNILFIASGAFSLSKVQDMIPQLLGRLPIRVNMHLITTQQLKRILCQPKYNLLFQQIKLLQQQGIKLQYTKQVKNANISQAIEHMAKFAFEMNENVQNLGARRLHSIIQKIIEDVSYDAENYKGKSFIVDEQYVEKKIGKMREAVDLAKFLI